MRATGSIKPSLAIVLATLAAGGSPVLVADAFGQTQAPRSGAAPQIAPFDMSPERSGAGSPDSQPRPQALPGSDRAEEPVRTQPVEPGAETAPPSAAPSSPPPTDGGPAGATSNGGDAGGAIPNDAASAATPVLQGEAFDASRRYIVPTDDLTLSGEIAERNWAIFLTPEEAGSASELNLGYQSSILVAPEASELGVFINGVSVVTEEVRSPDGVKSMVAKIPDGLLRAGSNTVSMRASLRHRTDCTIQSTFDLWVQIVASDTFLKFDREDAGVIRRIEDLRAIGYDSRSRTRFRVVVPEGELTNGASSIIGLGEGLSLMARMPNQAVTVSEGSPPPSEEGALTVLVGPFGELADLGADLAGLNGPVVDMRPLAGGSGQNALVLSGRNWNEVETAIASILASNDRPVEAVPEFLSNSAWRLPDAPLFINGRSVALSELGVRTTEFTGRRFHTDFTIALPADFYAQAYGEMRLLLDAAYTNEILPGSTLDIYVNGNIATTVPIGGDGRVMRKVPIPITMRHLVPGINDLSFEANLVTERDEACIPGANQSADADFAFFNTSRLTVPDFARISTRPSLTALRGVGYPYNRATQPVPLILAGTSPQILSAAATLMGRMSVVASRPVPFSLRETPQSAARRDAIFVGVLPQMSERILQQVGIAARAETGSNGGGSDAVPRDSDQTLDRWRDEIGQPGWRQPFENLGTWLSDNFDLSLEDLRIAPEATGAYTPAPNTTFLMSQGMSPADQMLWTFAGAPTLDELASGMESVTSREGWQELGGRVTSLAGQTGRFEQAPTGEQTLVQSQPLGFRNMRLVVTNWLSENVLSYATLLAISALILGIATTVLTSVLGRRE